jgi:hypothetical protein
MSELSNSIKKHTSKPHETIPLRSGDGKNKLYVAVLFIEQGGFFEIIVGVYTVRGKLARRDFGTTLPLQCQSRTSFVLADFSKLLVLYLLLLCCSLSESLNLLCCCYCNMYFCTGYYCYQSEK